MNDKQQRLPASPDSEGSSLKLWLWFLVAMLLAFYWSALSVQQEAQPITYSEFKALVRSDKIAGVTFAGRQMTGTYIEGERKPGQTAHFSTLLPDIDDPELLQLLETHKVTVNAKSAEPVWWLRILFSMLPWVLVLALIFYVSSKMQERLLKGGGPGGIFGFGQSRAKRFEVTATQVSFDDVAGVDNAKRDLEEIVEFLKNPQRFRKLGAKIPRGVLLMGPPGTGKTMLAKALAGEAGVPFYSISGSEFIEMFVGVGAARVRDMFESAHKDAPAVIFIDEIDSVGRTRGTGLGGGHDEREQTLNQILGEMDGFQPHEAVVCWPPPTAPTCSTPPCCAPAASTARWCWTCRARTRGARSCRYTAAKSRWRMTSTSSWWRPEPWDFPARTWRIWSTKPRCRQPGTTRNGWTWRTFPTPATRSCWAPSGKPWPARTRRNWWPTTSRGTRSPQSSCRTPTRWTRSPSSPHGLALGATELLPEEELHNLRYSYLLDRIGVMLAGRAAEQVVFGEVSSGAENDLKQATRLARLMVSQWGMSEKLGPAAFPRGEEHPFLGREMAQPRDFSEQTAQLIDEEVRALMCEREQHVRGLLEQHRRQLETLAQALLERESLSADEVSALLGGDMAVAASG